MEQSLHKNWKIPLNIDDFGISPTKYGDFPSRFFHGKSPTTKMDDNYIYILINIPKIMVSFMENPFTQNR
jgi:hypothetical protein